MNNLELYKTFYYVAKAGSITAAAQQLSLTQPAVSQSMKQLEAQLNVSLFQRTAKGIRLTKEGEILFPYAESCCESIRQGEQKLKELMNLDLGEIRIGASDMTLKYYLLPFLEQFHRRYRPRQYCHHQYYHHQKTHLQYYLRHRYRHRYIHRTCRETSGTTGNNYIRFRL